MPPARTTVEMKAFLEGDFYDAYRWLFEGALAWSATDSGSERCRHQRVIAMFASLVQARALYEFYFKGTGRPDDARSTDFTTNSTRSSWHYDKYMDHEKPANKRIFHLVYGRESHSGGVGHDAPDHLKHQVLDVAQDLRDIGWNFVDAVDDPALQGVARQALTKATEEAALAAAWYGVDPNPLR